MDDRIVHRPKPILQMIVRKATLSDAEAIGRIHVASWRETYTGIVPDEFLAALSAERRAEQWRAGLANPESRTIVLVGEIRPGDVVGFAACGPEREGLAAYPGELYAIYVLKEAQGRGLGRAMLETAARHLAEAGHEAWMCWVLADNPTRHFYEAMGGVAFQQKDIEIGGRTLVEVAYGWK